MWNKIIFYATWGWIIAVGVGIIITPKGPVCTICGDRFNIAIGAITVAAGVLGIFATVRSVPARVATR
jgi:hypothetical protein